jgi:enamine deaminase RidA (YjgF/YER057c/UK114 family)
MAKTITPKAFGPPTGLYSAGMIAPAGELVIVAGQVGAGPSGAVIGDIVGQTKQVFENIRLVLEAAGCAFRDVVRLQTFLTRTEDIPGFMKAREEVFAALLPDGGYPPNTLVIVTRLFRPELLVEIEAMAVRRAGAARSPKARAGAGRKKATSSRARPRRRR